MNRYFNSVLIAIIALLLIRLLSLGLYPLTDTTEARYGEIARIMAETGDWITPYFDYDVPFWGKPPLSFWLSALSFKVFGVNEFAARFPSWLCSLSTLLILVRAETILGIRERFLASLLLVSTLVFYVVAGGVMTEASLVLGLVLSLVSLLQLIARPQANYRWSFCLGLGLAIGMLAKGPIALVMVGAPLVFWMLVHRQWHLITHVRCWLPAIVVFLLLSLPWYILAEQKTPGFIDYFILGEHFYRFIQPGWSGDLYGTAHREAYGTIWWFWLLAAFPSSWWVLSLLGRKLFNSQGGESSTLKLDHFDYLLLYFAFFPQVFFCFAGNILMSYVVPGVPALALFIARHAHLIFNEKSRQEALA